MKTTTLNISPGNRSKLAKRRSELLSKQTPEELNIAKLLNELGVKFIPQKGFLNVSTHFIVDFYIPKGGICIEVDGQHHYLQPQLGYDRGRDRFLEKQRGFRVVRIPNHIAISMTASELATNL